MKKIINTKKLTLNRETLTSLSEADMGKAQGGMFTTKPSVYNCPPINAAWGGYGGGYGGGGYGGGGYGGGGYGGGGYGGGWGGGYGGYW
jgi:hypothetical protein